MSVTDTEGRSPEVAFGATGAETGGLVKCGGMKMKKQKITAMLEAVLAAVFYALNMPFSKILLADVPSTIMAGLLYLGAGVGVGVMFLCNVRRADRDGFLSREDLPYTVGMVALDILAPVFLMYGLSHTTSANASLLNNFEIVATTVIAFVIFKEAVSKRLWAAIFFVTVSSMLLSLEDVSGLRFSWGSLFVLLAAVCWGFENNCTRNISGKNTHEIVTIKGLCSGTGSLVIGLALGQRLPSAGYIVSAMVLGFVAYGLSIFFYIRAQKELGAAKTSAYYAIAPFVGAFLSFLILKEPLSVRYGIALALMILGSGLATADTLLLRHRHMHTHVITHTHDGFTHTHVITHSHAHDHFAHEDVHRHIHVINEHSDGHARTNRHCANTGIETSVGMINEHRAQHEQMRREAQARAGQETRVRTDPGEQTKGTGGKLRKLFSSTFYLSACTFGGGYVIVSLMKQIFVDELHWIEEDEMLDLIAIAQSSPGPVAVNGAVAVGYRLCGIPGVLAGTLGAVLPPFIILAAVTGVYRILCENAMIAAMLKGMQAGVAAVIASVVFDMTVSVKKKAESQAELLLAVLIMAAAFCANYVLGVGAAWIILACGAFGAVRTVASERRAKRS